MEDSVNYAEYTVAKKPEGENLKKRIALIIVYLVYIAAVVAVVVATQGGGAMLGFLFFLLFIIIVFFSWKLVKEDRKYECLNAKLVISELNEGIGSKPKVVSEDLISSYSVIAPAIKDFRGDSKSPDSYFARLEKDGKSTVILFETTNKMLKIMKFYNSKGTVVTEVRR